MADKYRRISEGLILIISKRVISSTNEQLDNFREIEERIRKATANIEEASELKDYLEVQIST